MSAQNMNGMLEKARQGKYAIGAFDVPNYDFAQAVADQAMQDNAPVILQVLKPDLAGNRGKCFGTTLRIIAEQACVPTAVHLDHANTYEECVRAIENGFTSVMLDASAKPLQENIELTAKVVAYAHKHGVSVEAELGHMADGLIGSSASAIAGDLVTDPNATLTVASELAQFIQGAKPDAVAVAIGTAHGVYVTQPKLHFDKLTELNQISAVPLVMHGGSGTPVDDVQKAIALGICKINIYTEILNAYWATLKPCLNEQTLMGLWPTMINEKPLLAVQEVVHAKICAFGSANKA